jgi:hypothetical protein
MRYWPALKKPASVNPANGLRDALHMTTKAQA